jgi:hypothetical protein
MPENGCTGPLKIKLYVTLQSLIEVFMFSINIWRVTLEMGAETREGLQMKCPLSHFNQRFDVSTNCKKKNTEYQISRTSLERFSISYTGQCNRQVGITNYLTNR